MLNNILTISILLCSLLLSSCAKLHPDNPLPAPISIYNNKPSCNLSDLGFKATLCLDFTGNRFAEKNSFRNGLKRYLGKYAPEWWVLNCSEFSIKEKKDEIRLYASVNAHKSLTAFSDFVAEISLSSNIFKDTLEYSVLTASKFNGNIESTSVDNYDLGVIVGKSILNKLNTVEEFIVLSNARNNKRKVEEQRQLSEKKQKQTPEVANQKTTELYNKLSKDNLQNQFTNSIKAYHSAESDGYKPTHLPTFSTSLIVLDELKTGLFPTEASNLPLKPILLNRKEIKKLMGKKGKVILVQPVSSNVKRDILSQSKVKSEYISGYREKHNPAHDAAYRDYQRALDDYNSVQADISSQSSAGSLWWLQGIGNAALSANASNTLDNAQEKLTQTPQTTSVPIKQDYSYNVMQVKVSKNISYNIYIIDLNTNKVSTKKYNKSDDKTFKLQYGRHSDDSGWHVTYYNENEVETYEKEKLTFSVENIVNDLVKTASKEFTTKPCTNSLCFIKTPKKTQKKKTVAQKPKAVKGKLSNLIQSVVAIQDNGGRTIGTGFFVNDNLILTNRHVVGERKLISVSTKAGKKYVGKVLDAHYDLDIALVEVDGTGSPVKMHLGRPVSEGEEVIAIGNPMGFEYSVTKGIISSIRKSKDKKKPLSKEYTYIQTDVPINPGNSGGPLFMNGKVVGINTSKIVSDDVEGIGFAIHYDEILEYLDSNDVHLARKKAKPIPKQVVLAKKSTISQEDAAERKLTHLKKMFDKGLITKDEYKTERSEVLEKF